MQTTVGLFCPFALEVPLICVPVGNESWGVVEGSVVQERILASSTVAAAVTTFRWWCVCLKSEGVFGECVCCSVCHLASPDHQIASVMSDLPGRVAL